MNRNTKLASLLSLYICIAVSAFAQKPGTPLSQQYTDVVVRSGVYNGFKEIRQDKIELFWKNIQDTLSMEKQKTIQANARLLNIQQDIIKSKVATENAERALAEAQARKDQISLFGIYMKKSSYNLLMWGIAGLLGAGLAFAIYRSKSAVAEAHYRTTLFNELTEEFQRYKANANEKEKKLARELQTERNLVEELRGR